MENTKPYSEEDRSMQNPTEEKETVKKVVAFGQTANSRSPDNVDLKEEGPEYRSDNLDEFSMIGRGY